MTSAAAAPAPAPTASASAAPATAAATLLRPHRNRPSCPDSTAGVYDIEAQIVVAGSYAGLEAFEHQLEGMHRSVLVHTISITSCTNGAQEVPAGSGLRRRLAGGLSCTADAVAA